MRRHTVFSGQPFASRDLITPLAGGSSEAVPPCGRLEVVIMPKRLSPCRCALSRSARLMPLVCCRGLLLVMALMLPITAFAAVVRKNPQDLAASSILGTYSNPEQGRRGYASVGQERAN
jgi:hypothetical protein